MIYEDAVKILLHLNTVGALIEGEAKDEERAEAISMAIQALRSCHEQEPLSEKIEKKAYGEIMRLRNDYFLKWQECNQCDENRSTYKAKYEAFDKAMELLQPVLTV